MGVVVPISARPTRRLQTPHGPIANIPPREAGPTVARPLALMGGPSDITSVDGRHAIVEPGAPGHAINAIG